MRAHTHALIAYLCVVATCLAVVPTACTKNDRMTTIQTALIAVNAARDGFHTWDRHHRSEIIQSSATREEAVAKLEAYGKERETITDLREAAYQVLAVAATQTDEPSLKAALAKAAELVTAIKKLTGGP